MAQASAGDGFVCQCALCKSTAAVTFAMFTFGAHRLGVVHPPLVFCDVAGDYLKPDSITAKACLAARKAGFQNVGIHTLRHSHGSQLLSKGVSLPTVSKRLGHSSVATTANIYAHALPKDDIKAAELWDDSIRTAMGTNDEKVS